MSTIQNDPHNLIEKTLSEIHWADLTTAHEYYPSPTSWDDELLYFLFIDRFSDGSEYGGFADNSGAPVNKPSGQRSTTLFNVDSDAWQADREAWFNNGKTWCGGNIVGMTDKLGYLQRLGVTAVWLSPVFKQVSHSNDYHGYGIQNFIDIDPHFGTRDELRQFVAAAHDVGIRVILDIILNHAGDVFAYGDNQPREYSQGREWPVAGFRKQSDDGGSLPFDPIDLQKNPDAWPDGAVWPKEFQNHETWTRKGAIHDEGWDAFPHYLDGDFLSLKDIEHGEAPRDPSIAWDLNRRIREFHRTSTLDHLIDVFKFWIAFADVDGYRIDTVKHMEPGAVRVFANSIHEYAQSLGKDNFYLIGEVTGGRQNAVNIVNTTGINAALGINDIPDKLEFLVKGWRSPGHPDTAEQEGYFDLFRNSLLDNKYSHQWFGQHVVTMFDDHDQVGTRHKFRFCGDSSDSYRVLKAAVGMNLTTIGIPCLYYGTEQGFNGADQRTTDDDDYSDVFLRECMFGGPFGSLQSTGRHFFNEGHEIYQFIETIASLRKQHIALRRGRQYLREVSSTGRAGEYYYPQPVNNELRWVIAWSRIFADRECLCAINTDINRPIKVWVTVDNEINKPDKRMTCLHSTDHAQTGSEVAVVFGNGSSIVITVPAGGFVIYH